MAARPALFRFQAIYKKLLILVHFLVVFLIVAAGDVLHPLLVVEIPVDGQDDALLKRGLGVPAQILLDLGGVDAIAAVMAQTVSDVLDEVFADAVVLQAVVQLLNDGLDDEDVGALVVAADIVDDWIKSCSSIEDIK